MKNVVYKYQLERSSANHYVAKLPVGAQVLQVGLQGSGFVCWALVDNKEQNTEIAEFLILGTGHEVNDPTLFDNQYVFLNTCFDGVKTAMFPNGIVIHIFKGV